MTNTTTAIHSFLSQSITAINDEIFCYAIDQLGLDPGLAYDLSHFDIPMSDELEPRLEAIDFDTSDLIDIDL